MNGRPLFLGAVFFLTGIIYTGILHGGRYGGERSREVLALAVCLGVWNILLRIKRRGLTQGVIYGVIFVSAFVMGVWHMGSEQEFRERYEPQLQDGECAGIQGTVYKKEMGEYPRYYLKSCYLSRGEESEAIPCNQILVYLDTDSISIGSIITVSGTIQLLEPARNEGNFDEQAFYQSQKIDFKFYGEEMQVVKNGNTSLGEKLYRKKEQVKEVYCNILGEKKAGILSTMVLGDRELLEDEIKELYQKAGISHILAISGLHISIIGMGLYGFLQRCGLPPVCKTAAAAGIMTIFAMLAGAGVSTKRAVLMFFLLLLGNLTGRSYDSLTSLGMAAILLLWENPFVYGYSGFQLSFLAVLGANAGGMMVRNGRRDEKYKQKYKLRKQIAAAFMIQAFTIPVIAWCYYELPVYVILVNLLILPTAGILLFLGILGGIFGCVYPVLGWLPLKMAGVLLEVYEVICRCCLRLPKSTWVTGKPDMRHIILFYILLALLLILIYYLQNLSCIPETALLIAFLLLFQPGKPSFQVKVLDVGQGDGIYIESGTGNSYFIDGGSVDISKVGNYRILPFLKSQGRQRIDCWFVSHCDADHINGLEEVLEADYPVRRLVFSKEVVRDDAFEKLRILAEQKGCLISYLEQGERVTDEEVCFTALYPGSEDGVDDRNANSLVLLLETGNFRGLLTGDIGKEQEEELKAMGIGRIDWYKAAHHGSKESNSRELLEILKPQIATISCGIGNSYGHPGKEAVEHMEESGAKIYETTECGQITITGNQEERFIETYLRPPEVDVFHMLE